MTLEHFLEFIYFKTSVQIEGNLELILTTTVTYRNEDDSISGPKKITTKISIEEFYPYRGESLESVNWAWEKFIDDTKRMHLYYFGQMMQIENWNPIDKSIDISFVYRSKI